MRITITQGNAAGTVEEMTEDAGQNAIDTGYGELAPEEAPVAPVVAEVAPVGGEGMEGGETAKGGDEDSVLASWTIAQLEDLGDEYGIEAASIEGTGAGGRVVKADWVRVLDARMAEAEG